MNESSNPDANYRIEVSGWCLDGRYFVEHTDLFWDGNGNKKLFLHHAPHEGAVVFIRLLTVDSASGTLPMAYRAATVQPTNCNGQSEVRLEQLHPRTKVSEMGNLASYVIEDREEIGEAKESSAQWEREEVLQ